MAPAISARGSLRTAGFALWIAVASVVISAQPTVVGDSSFAATSPSVALASSVTPDTLTIGGEPVVVGVEGDPQTVSVSFEATAGQRVAVNGESLDGYSWIGLQLLSPTGVELGSQQDWGSAFVEPVTLPSTGTYTVEVVPGYGQAEIQVTPAQPDVSDQIDPALDPIPWERRFAPGENALLDMPLDAGQQVFITTATQFEGDGFGNPDFGYDDVDLQLLDPSGDVVADTNSYSGEATIEFAATEAGTYQIDFDPKRNSAGHLELRAFDVTDPVVGQISIGGGDARVVATAPGQTLRLQFEATEGQRLRARTLMGGGDVQEILDPDGEVISENWGGGFPTFVAPATGTYQINTRLGLYRGNLRALVREASVPPVTELTLDGPMGQASIVGDEGEVAFHVTSEPGQRVKFVVSAGSAVGGHAELFDASGNSVDNRYIPDDLPAALLSDPAGGDYTVIVSGSAGQVTARARRHDAPNRAAVTPDGGPVSISAEGGYAYTDVELNSSTEYRMRVTSGEGTGAFSLYAPSPTHWWNYIDFAATDRDDVWTFTPPDTGTYTISMYSWDWETYPIADVEIYTSVGAPEIDIDRGSPDIAGGVNVHADWVTDSGEAIVGYAVAVDQQPTTDPGTTPTQQASDTDLQLAPGDHWLHVRAIDASGNFGAVSHRRIRVAPELAGVTLDSPQVSPGSPGYATTDTPMMSVAVPPIFLDAEVRLTLRMDGRWLDSFNVPVVHDRAEGIVPASMLKPGKSYSVSAQVLDSDGRLGPPGASTDFTVDPLAAEVSPEACSGPDCHATTQALFDGSLAADADAVLNLDGIADEESDDWVADAYLLITSEGANDEPISVYAGDRTRPVQPTLDAAGVGRTVRISPSLDDEIILHNGGSQGVDLEVTLQNWRSGYTAQLQQLDEDIDAMADQMIDDEHLLPSEGLQAVVADLEPPREPVCGDETDGLLNCLGQGTPAPEGEPEARTGATMRADAMSARAGITATPPSSFLDGECYDAAEHWVYVTRGRACRISSNYYNTVEVGRNGAKEVGRINFLLFERVDFGFGTGIVTNTSRAYWTSATGVLTGKTLTVNHNITCVRLCTSHRITSDQSEHISSYERWSGYMISQAKVSLSQGAVVDATGEDIYSSLAAIASGHTLQTDAPGGPPNFRCDRRREVKMFDRDTGCVFDDLDPVLELNPYIYPNHAALVNKGQASLWLHPGATYDEWDETTRPLTRIVGKGSGNRRVAQNLCKAKNVKQSCDEYPYNATLQGCRTGMGITGYPTPLTPSCVVRDVPLSENKSAGSWLLALLRLNRVLYDDDYYISVFNDNVPTAN